MALPASQIQQTNLLALLQQQLVELFGADVLAFRGLQVFEDLDPWRGDLEPGVFELLLFWVMACHWLGRQGRGRLMQIIICCIAVKKNRLGPGGSGLLIGR